MNNQKKVFRYIVNLLNINNNKILDMVVSHLLGKYVPCPDATYNEYDNSTWFFLEKDRGYPFLIKHNPHASHCRCHKCMEIREKREKNNFPIEGKVSTKDIARFFNSRANGISKEQIEKIPDSQFYVANSSFAIDTIGGYDNFIEIIDKVQDPNWDGNEYDLLDLEDIDIGECIYRVSCRGTLWFFQKTDEKEWDLTVMTKMEYPITIHGHPSGYPLDALIKGAEIASLYHN